MPKRFISYEISIGPDASGYQKVGIPQTQVATSDQQKLQIRYAAIVSAAAAHSVLTFTASGQEFVGVRTGTGWILSGNGTTVPKGEVTVEAVLDLLKSTMTVVLPKDNELERRRKRFEAKKKANEKRSAATEEGAGGI